uniref:Vitellogenin domain-containing protein n=1 Tax=Tetranychus urticae TaxID=32264 RepID=T1KSY0_TETUR
MDLRLGYILLFIYCVQTVTPARLPLTKSGQQCSLQCTESKNLNYQPGKTYIYDYVGKTWINSNDGTEQLIEVKAKAHVSVISKCELSLQLENVELTGLQSDHALKRELEDRLIGFSYQDGSIASVCPSPEDSNWSINIKKAIISALQVSSTPKSGKTIVTEVDILGECETNYEAVAIPSSSNVLESIKKFKNLRNCNQRQANVFSLFPTKYSTDLNSVQNLPILNNEHSCSIEISKESIVSRVICTDSATFIPLSWTKSVTSGFNSELTLTLEASVPSKPVKPISHSHLSNRQALTFKHTLKESWANSKGDVDQVTNLLKDICSSVENQIEPKVPSQFAELVYHLRNLPSSSTSKLWLAIKRGDICPSVAKLTDLFTDALIMDGSEGSLKIIVELINEGKTAPVTVNYWLTLLAFASSPTEGSIKSLLPLIKNKSLPRQSVLGVSALVHNYCALPDVDCNSSPIVNEVTRTIASRLSYKCSVSPGAEDDTIVALKGLANIAPYLSNGEIRSILECSVNSNSLHVRVTAIETLQSLSCLDSVAPTMMDLFTSTEHDAEIRIAAYKNVIACPSASKIEAIILTLENEPSVQVGSYIVSHLSNIQESSDPLKSEMKLYLTGIKIPLKSFPRDIRKFSRYYELSQHFSKINLGAVIESDVIFDGSYIPRSIKANLSIPMFGSSVNLAEVGFRQKGLESSIEGLFGPSGSLNGKNWKEILESLASLLINENDPNEIEANRYRLARRSVQDIFRPIKLESLVKKATITSAPVEGSMYLKVDGKTIIYLSVNDIKKESYKSMFDSKLENVVKSSKYDRAFSFMVLDSIHQFPGINGFPIKLDINSTAIFGYKQTGKTFYPSFASELSVKVGFDARTSQPGLKWKTIRNGKVLKAMVNIDPNYSQQLESITWPSLNLRKSQWNGLPSTMTVNWQIFSDIYQPMGQSIMEESFEFVGELDQHTLPVRSFFSEYVSLPSISLPTINFYPLVDRLSAWADEMSTKAAVQLKSVCRYKSSCYRIAHAYERYGMDGLTRIASDNWRVYKISLKNWFQNITSKVLRASDDMYESILSYFNNLSSKLWSSQYGSILTKKLHQISKFPCRLTKSISSGVQRFYSNLNRRVMSNPDVRALVNIIVSLYREISSELAKINIKSSLKSSASQYNYLLSPSTWGASARYTTWNPAKGFYEAEIVSPVDIGTVKSTLRSSQKSVSDINDSLNSLKASLWTELTPPFKSTAFLIGGQHFVTFDGRSFDLGTTDCSYLLARDFVNSNFSVIVRYHGGNKKSFLITLGEEQVIEINPSEKRVKLGRNIVELPVIQGSLSILRHHQTIVLEDSSNGLTFKCFLSRDLCSLTVSGWYFGRTKGLFGTYDYEPSNDYLLPDGRQAANPNDLASGWEVEGSCANPSGVPIQSEEIRRSSKAYRLCEKTFSSSESPLAEGFQYVSPDFYFLMCRRHMAATKGQDRPEKALCNIAGAYVEQVRANGFELSMPLACLTCEAGQEFGSRYVASPTRSSSRADVVFIIEERPCNAKLINDLPNLARNMHKELEQSGLKDPRFGVVAFGGPAVNTREAHGHTARGELLFPYQDIAMSTKRMELAPIDSYDANYTDALSAIVLASQYPFRKAASKNLVLLSCRACDERTSRFDYNDIQHLLLSEGITLHVVSNQRFSTKRATSKTREILGIDRRSVQRASDIRANEVSDERVYLRDSITVPKDVCISLAHLSNGSFYPSPLVTSLDHRLEKLWSLGLARRLASTADPSPCQHCDCVPDSDLLHSKILCRPCRPLKPVY